jgi:hypothetical protein
MIKRGKWSVWPHSAYHIMHNLNCSDTIDGICTTGETVDECIDRCEKSEDCKAGYHIQLEDQSICAPLRTSIYDNYDFVSRVCPQSEYKEFDDADVTVFMDSSLVQPQTKYIFHRDIVTLKHVQSDKLLSNSTGVLKFDAVGAGLSIRTADDVTTHSSIYSPVMYGDSFFFSIPSTALLSTLDPINRTFEWKIIAGYIVDLSTFKVVPVNKDRLGSRVTLDDEFKLVTNTNSYIGLDDDILYVNSRDTGDTFKFVSYMDGYKCDGSCTSVPIHQSDTRNMYCMDCTSNIDSDQSMTSVSEMVNFDNSFVNVGIFVVLILIILVIR